MIEGFMKRKCTNCGKPNLHGVAKETLRACIICKAAYYCGKECQTYHWKAGHKIDCIKNYPPRLAELKLQAEKKLQAEMNQAKKK